MKVLNFKKIYFSLALLALASIADVSAQTVDRPRLPDTQTTATADTPDSSKKKLTHDSVRPLDSPGLQRSEPFNPITKNEELGINPPEVPADTLRHLSLDKAIELLTQNNLTVVATRYNISIAQAQKIAAGLRPSASVTVSVNQLTIPRLFKKPKDFYTTDGVASANSSYTVEYDRLMERGNKRSLRISQADLNAKAAEILVKDALRQQIFQLRQSFLAGLLARENWRLAFDNLGSFDGSQRILAAQVHEGYSAGVDLKRIELQRLQFQRDVSIAEQNFRQSTRDIYNLIGVGDAFSLVDAVQNVNYEDVSMAQQLKADLEILDGNLDVEPVLLSVEDLRRLALENRPDVKVAELNLEAGQVGIKLAQAQQKRDITFGVQYLRSGSDNAIGVVTTVPLMMKKRVEIAIGESQTNVRIAEAQLRLVQTQAITDVEKAFTAYLISRGRLRLFTNHALGNALDVRRIEELSYRDGAKGLLEYLDAQRIYNQTLLDYSQSRYDFLLSLAQLEAATGTNLPVK